MCLPVNLAFDFPNKKQTHIHKHKNTPAKQYTVKISRCFKQILCVIECSKCSKCLQCLQIQNMVSYPSFSKANFKTAQPVQPTLYLRTNKHHTHKQTHPIANVWYLCERIAPNISLSLSKSIYLSICISVTVLSLQRAF